MRSIKNAIILTYWQVCVYIFAMKEFLSSEYQAQRALFPFLKSALKKAGDKITLELKSGDVVRCVRFKKMESSIAWSVDGEKWLPYVYLYSALGLHKGSLLFRPIQHETDKGDLYTVANRQRAIASAENSATNENKEFLILKRLAQKMLNSIASCEDENLKKLTQFLAKKTLRTRNGKLRSDGPRGERVLPALLVLLHASESQAGREKLSQFLNHVLNRFYTDSLNKARKISAFFYEKGFTHKDVFYLLSVADLNFVKVKIIDRWDDLLKLFKDKKYIAKVASYSHAKDKFDFFASMKEDKLYELSQLFNGYHLSQIVVGADWEKKLAVFAGHKVMIGNITIGGEEDLKKWKNLFNGCHLSQIVRNRDWEKKLAVFAGHKVTIGDITIGGEEDLRKWKSLFNDRHLPRVVVGADWEKKLAVFAGHKVTIGDITIGGEEDLRKWKSLFNGSHLSQIVYSADWEKKLAVFAGHKVTIGNITIGGEEDLKKWKSLFNGSHLSRIVRIGDWEKKLALVLDKIPTIINKINEFVVKNSIHENSIFVIKLKLGLLLSLSLDNGKGKWRKAFLDCLCDVNQVLSIDLNQFEIDLLTRTQNAKNRRAVLSIYTDMENDYGISSKGISILLSAIYGGVLGKVLGVKNTISSSSGAYSFDTERSASDERTMHTLVGKYDEAFDAVDTKHSLRACLPDNWDLSDEYLEELANSFDKSGISNYERITYVSQIIYEYFLAECNCDATKAQKCAKETLLYLLNLEFKKIPPDLFAKLSSRFQ